MYKIVKYTLNCSWTLLNDLYYELGNVSYKKKWVIKKKAPEVQLYQCKRRWTNKHLYKDLSEI